ncbi:MAG: hypothetical protein AB7O66_15890 [Limisphaerales bacterium]
MKSNEANDGESTTLTDYDLFLMEDAEWIRHWVAEGPADAVEAADGARYLREEPEFAATLEAMRRAVAYQGTAEYRQRQHRARNTFAAFLRSHRPAGWFHRMVDGLRKDLEELNAVIQETAKNVFESTLIPSFAHAADRGPRRSLRRWELVPKAMSLELFTDEDEDVFAFRFKVIDPDKAGVIDRFVLSVPTRDVRIDCPLKPVRVDQRVLWVADGQVETTRQAKETPPFAVSDITNLRSLATRLGNPREAVSRHVSARLSPQSARILSTWSQAPQEPGSIRPVLVQELNAMLAGPSLWDPEAFAGITLRAPTRDLCRSALQTPALDANGLRRLNRCLLEDAFAGELRSSTEAASGRLPLNVAEWERQLEVSVVPIPEAALARA